MIKLIVCDIEGCLTSVMDITPKGIDKFSGLQFLLEKLQLYPEDVAGIGDTRGDILVLKKLDFRYPQITPPMKSKKS